MILLYLYWLALLMLAISGWIYGLYIHRQAKHIEAKHMHRLRVDYGLAIAKADRLAYIAEGFQEDLQEAHARIKQLEAMARIPMKRMPTGSLVQGFNKKQEAERTNPIPTQIIPHIHIEDVQE